MYRLLGNSPYPELQKQQEDTDWIDDANAVRFQADVNGPLYSKLCNATNGSCNYAPIVTLSADIACTNAECAVDTIRTVEVETVEVETGIFYEYIRPACVHLAFYDNAKKMKMRNGGSRTYVCGDPRTEEAGAICCDSNNRAFRQDEYWAERVRFSTAESRCNESSYKMCTSANIKDCDAASCAGDPYYWTTESCQLKIKIGSDRKVAIVHSAYSEEVAGVNAMPHVDVDTKTFFRVHWNEVTVVDHLLKQCGVPNLPCNVTADGCCLCDVSVSEDRAFSEDSLPTKEEVLALSIGAFKPSGNKTRIRDGVYVYGSGPYSKDTVFEVAGHANTTQFRKNMISRVLLIGTTPTLEFRSPVHFVSAAEENERDSIQETEAAIDHYFFHTNMAPFLALRLAQRFGLSNPTPQYIKVIANAFKEGEYTSTGGVKFGTGRYGDLAATLAAVLLHSEARNSLLEADMFHGSFREPLLKLIQLMRSLGFQYSDETPILKLGNLEDTIMQMAFKAPGM